MGATLSLLDQVDFVGPESVVSILSQCRLADVRTAFYKLKERGSSDHHVNASTLALGLPLPISTATALVHLLQNKETNSIDIGDCFNALTFFGHGSAEERIRLFYLVHGWDLGSEVDSPLLEAALLHLLHGADRVYEADPWIQMTANDGLYNLLNVAYELTEEIEYLTERSSFHHSDLEKWLYVSLSACFATEAMYPASRCDKDDSASNENASNNISGNNGNSYTWVKVACDRSQAIPSGRSKHAIAVHDGYIYLYGGRDRSIGHKDLWRFEIASNKWERMSCTGDRPFLLQEHTMVVYNGKMYVFGGEFSSSWSKEAPLWILNLAQKRWSKPEVTSEVTVPCGRRGHTAVVTNHQMHIYGGYLDLKGTTSDLWTFDMEHEMWHLAYRAGPGDDGAGTRHSHSAIVHNNAMWIYGGMSDLTPRSDLWRWHFKLRKWRKLKCKNGPPALAGHSACKVPSGMVVYGGESAGVIQSDLWRYTFSTQTWQRLSCDGLAPFPRSHHCTVVLPSFMLQQAWLAAGSDRSLSAPLLKDPALLAQEESKRPRSSPAANLSGPSPFTNSVSPADQKVHLAIGRPGTLQAVPAAAVRPLEETISLMQQVTDKLGSLTRSTDTVEVLTVKEGSPDVMDVEHGSYSQEYSVEERAAEMREHIKQWRNAKTIDSVSLSRLLSAGSESSEEWLGYDNCISLENSGQFTSLKPFGEEEGSPTKRPKSHSITDSSGFLAHTGFHLKSASVESILSMSHNPNLPPPHWLTCREKSRPDLTHSAVASAIRSRSWDSLLRSFGGVGLSTIDISTDPQAVELTSFNRADLILEDLEDRDADPLDLTPTPGTPQSTSPQHISISPPPRNAERDFTDTRVLNAWPDPPADTSQATLPDLLADVTREESSTSFSHTQSPAVRSAERRPSVDSNKEDRKGGDIELTNLSQRKFKSQASVSPGAALRKYLSHRGARTCDTVHIYVFGGKESCNIGTEPLPVWRLDVREVTDSKYSKS